MFPFEIDALARLLVDECRERHVRIVTAESCTGGLVAAAITAIPGSSDVFERGFVTYSNRAKEEMLGVPGDLIADLGGPGGGTPMKPLGTVHVATARANGAIEHRLENFDDMTRDEVRKASVRVALEMLRERVN